MSNNDEKKLSEKYSGLINTVKNFPEYRNLNKHRQKVNRQFYLKLKPIYNKNKFINTDVSFKNYKNLSLPSNVKFL